MNRHILTLVLLLTTIVSACVKDEPFVSPPVIKQVFNTPQSPVAGEAVTITAIVLDREGRPGLRLYYKIDQGSFEAKDMNPVNDSTFTAVIPGLEDGKTVAYYVEARGKTGKKSLAPAGAPATTAAYSVGAPLVVMNEIYSRGTATSPDWIEIYNASDGPADISGFKIYDNGGQSGAKPKKTIPDGTIIPAKGYYVIETEGSGDPSDFGLSSAGETVWLENAKGNVIDEVAFPAMDASQSYGRLPDGSPNWQLLSTITRGQANSGNTPPPTIKIVMNEIYSRGTAAEPDWIEIYNDGNAAVDISGWLIYDNGGQGGTKPKKTIPAGTVIASKGFYVINTEGSGDPSDFGLSSNGETVWLEKPDGAIADQVAFPFMETTQSYGRKPDGSENWQLLNTITKGSTNNNAK
ncbi:MAG: lamin tail domain-containing protein [Bacteroidetes bacterium]|nr:lamin tail domain-containing protein [Bacteroidota bacterium]